MVWTRSGCFSFRGKGNWVDLLLINSRKCQNEREHQDCGSEANPVMERHDRQMTVEVANLPVLECFPGEKRQGCGWGEWQELAEFHGSRDDDTLLPTLRFAAFALPANPALKASS